MRKAAIVLIHLVCFIGCVDRGDHDPPIEIRLTSINADCAIKHDDQGRRILSPYELFFNVEVTNNMDQPLAFSTYNREFDRESRRYGYFQMIHENDTVDLYAGYQAIYDIHKNMTSDFQLSYRSGDLLSHFSIADTTDIVDVIKNRFENISLRYVPVRCRETPLLSLDSIYNDIKSDSVVIEYVNEGRAEVIIVRKGEVWKRLDFDNE